MTYDLTIDVCTLSDSHVELLPGRFKVDDCGLRNYLIFMKFRNFDSSTSVAQGLSRNFTDLRNRVEFFCNTI